MFGKKPSSEVISGELRRLKGQVFDVNVLPPPSEAEDQHFYAKAVLGDVKLVEHSRDGQAIIVSFSTSNIDHRPLGHREPKTFLFTETQRVEGGYDGTILSLDGAQRGVVQIRRPPSALTA